MRIKSVVSPKLPDNFLQEIVARNKEMLINFIKTNDLNSVARINHSQYSVHHLLALGGWKRSFEMLQERQPAERSRLYYFELISVGGHVNMINSVPWFGSKKEAIVTALSTAKHFGHAKLQNELTRLYKQVETEKTEKLPEHRMPKWKTKEYTVPPLHASIPSLLTICTHVVAAEASRNTTIFSPFLSSLPAKLIEGICLQIASDPFGKGYYTLTQLCVSNPDLENLIPTVAWIDASKAAERKTRAFTYQQFVADKDIEHQPLIDVFAEAHTFKIAPPDEFENSVTVLLQQPRQVGAPSIVSKSQFLTQFKTFTNGIFEDFDFSKVVVIGGSVIGSLLPIPENPPEEEEEEEEKMDLDESAEDEEKKEGAKEGPKEAKEKEAKVLEDESKKEEENKTEKKEKPARTTPITMEEYYSKISPFKSSDIDICIYGVSKDEFNTKVFEIYDHLVKKVTEAKKEAKEKGEEPNEEQEEKQKAKKEKAKKLKNEDGPESSEEEEEEDEEDEEEEEEIERGPVRIYQSRTNVVFTALFPFRHVQVTVMRFRDIWQILTGVDIDCSAFAFDGKTLWTSPRARLAVNHRWTIVDSDLYPIRGCPSYELRLIKYARRGFTIVDRNINLYDERDTEKEPKIDVDDYFQHMIAQSGPPQVSGARLLLAIVKWPRIARKMRKVSARTGIPYGPKVDFEDIDLFLDEIAEANDTGYGPDDSCLQEVSRKDLKYTDALEECSPGFGDSIHDWYYGLNKKQDSQFGFQNTANGDE